MKSGNASLHLCSGPNYASSHLSAFEFSPEVRLQHCEAINQSSLTVMLHSSSWAYQGGRREWTYGTEGAPTKATNEAQAALDLATLKKYSENSEHNIKQPLLGDRWEDTITQRIAGEVNSLTLALLNRFQQLGGRYAETLDDLDTELEHLDRKVAAHLAGMGFR
jgi:hypothetical protein